MRWRHGACVTRRTTRALWLVLAGWLLSGCGSMLTEGSGAAAGIAGVAIADQITDNAAVATGIGLGVQAATRAGVQYLQRTTRAEEQDAIALAASSLQVGDVAEWQVSHKIPIEEDAYGQVTVSRLMGGVGLQCKEVVFSVVSVEADDPEREQAFYVSTICQDGEVWRWANAEPATSRWGSLQ
ncbi:MAG: hypothetical protein ACTJHW_02250 [Paenalcaligenes sp.]